MSKADEMLLKKGFEVSKENESLVTYDFTSFSFDSLTFYKKAKYIFYPSANITLEKQ